MFSFCLIRWVRFWCLQNRNAFFSVHKLKQVFPLHLSYSPYSSWFLWWVIIVENCADHAPIFNFAQTGVRRLIATQLSPSAPHWSRWHDYWDENPIRPIPWIPHNPLSRHPTPPAICNTHCTCHTHTDNEPFDTDRRYVHLTCCSFMTETHSFFRLKDYREDLNVDFDLPKMVTERGEKLDGDQWHKLE